MINIFTTHSPKNYINDFQMMRKEGQQLETSKEPAAAISKGKASKKSGATKESETIRAIKRKLKQMKENQSSNV